MKTNKEDLLNELTEYVLVYFFHKIQNLNPEIWTMLQFGIPEWIKNDVKKDISKILSEVTIGKE